MILTALEKQCDDIVIIDRLATINHGILIRGLT